MLKSSEQINKICSGHTTSRANALVLGCARVWSTKNTKGDNRCEARKGVAVRGHCDPIALPRLRAVQTIQKAAGFRLENTDPH